jgi:hypothetical protein
MVERFGSEDYNPNSVNMNDY